MLSLLPACSDKQDDTSNADGTVAATDDDTTGDASSTEPPGTDTGTQPGTQTEPTTGDTDPTGEATTIDGETDGGDAACDPLGQDCPEGLKCTAYGKLPGDAWNGNKCVPEPPNGGAVGDECAIEGDDMFTGIDNCGKGTICLNVDEEQKNGFCVEFCSPDMMCPGTQGGSGVCIVTNDGALPICLNTCDPLLQDCQGSTACYGDPSGPPFICFTPDPQDGGMDGDPCDFTNACVAGLNCTQADTQEGCMVDVSGCCAPFCALDEMSCTGAEECLPFFTAEQPGFENVGICALPG